MRRPQRIALIALVAASTLAGTPHKAAATGLFPCRWNYNLYVGLHAGYDTAGESADCTHIPGTLTLSARLYRLTLGSHKWRLARSASRSWLNPAASHYLELTTRCQTGKVRAVFSWTLRNADGRLTARNTITTAPINDPGPHCRYLLG